MVNRLNWDDLGWRSHLERGIHQSYLGHYRRPKADKEVWMRERLVETASRKLAGRRSSVPKD